MGTVIFSPFQRKLGSVVFHFYPSAHFHMLRKGLEQNGISRCWEEEMTGPKQEGVGEERPKKQLKCTCLLHLWPFFQFVPGPSLDSFNES